MNTLLTWEISGRIFLSGCSLPKCWEDEEFLQKSINRQHIQLCPICFGIQGVASSIPALPSESCVRCIATVWKAPNAQSNHCCCLMQKDDFSARCKCDLSNDRASSKASNSLQGHTEGIMGICGLSLLFRVILPRHFSSKTCHLRKMTTCSHLLPCKLWLRLHAMSFRFQTQFTIHLPPNSYSL